MKIASSSGGTKNITLIGVSDVANMLFRITNDINVLSEEGIIRAGAFVAGEIQASIMGQRSETKSVDTGNFANSIRVAPMPGMSLTHEIKIYTDVEYAKFLEYGTKSMEPRSHFTNTALRVEPILKEEFGAEIKKICDKANK